MSLPEVHLIGGSRFEAVKLAPVATATRAAGLLTPVLVAGGRHPALVERALAAFNLAADVTLTMARGGGTPAEPFTEMIKQLDALWAGRPPAAVIVQDDSTTGLAAALAAFWRRIPVVHLEAGLRAGDFDAPFPGEANRRLVAQIAALHLAPTPLAAMNLLDEHIAAGDVLVTANSMADPTPAVAGRRLPSPKAVIPARPRPVVVTARRPESRDEPLDLILAAVRQVVEQHAEIGVIFASQPAPAVRADIEANVHTEDLIDFYAASWIGGDRNAVRYLLAPDAEIEWNLDLPVDEEEVVETLDRIALFADGVTVVSKACDADGAALVYDCAGPFGTARMAEFLTVAGGRITEVRQIYDIVAINRFFPGLVDEDR